MAVTQHRGEWVVGLNPDDRMPNDWLRMVARVFASYRKKPLKDSIVVYIDGLNLSLASHVNNIAVVDITPGQAFVDDQFIGFITDSSLTIDTSWMVPEITYCIVLQYRWLNQFPPPEPRLELVRDIHVNREEMLCLGKAICHEDPNNPGQCILEIIDEKVPWYVELVKAATGNTEVDEAYKLPYIIAIKSDEGPTQPGEDPTGGGEFPDDPAHPELEQGTLDIGWAVDFHHYVGNQVNYNARLHTDKNNDGILYVNGKKIITEMSPKDPNNPNDPVDTGDTYISIGNNITMIDSFDENNPHANLDSDSGKVCATLKTEHIALDGTTTMKAASWCFDHNTESSSFTNRTDYSDPTTIINDMTITNQVDVVTINGNPIWHQGNLISTGETIMFLGYHNSPPPTRQNGDPVEDGDTYYDTQLHTYFYYQAGEWTQVGNNDSTKRYEFVASEGQSHVALEYNPAFLTVIVGGITLSASEYTATDGQNIYFTMPLRHEEIVIVMTVMAANAYGVRVGDLADVDLINLDQGHALKYDRAQNKWINGPIGTNSLNDIGDVIVGNVQDGQYLKYNGASGVWIPENITASNLNDISDVTLTLPASNGESLVFDGTTWTNKNIVPAGTVIAWAGSTPPPGYFECDGHAVKKTTYPELYSAIGDTFNYPTDPGGDFFRVPDLRGEFIRGWDHGRGVDIGRNLGLPQGDAIRNITGSLNSGSTSFSVATDITPDGAFNAIGVTNAATATSSGSTLATTIIEFDASNSVPVSNEVRPRNVALMYCIKY